MTARPATGLPVQVLVRAVAEAASAISVADARRADTPLVYVNAAFEDLSGFAADDVIGLNCRVMQSPEVDPAARAQIRRAMADERPVRTRLLNRRPDGNEWWNELHLSPIRDEAGAVSHWLGVQIDVSDQVRDEGALRGMAFEDPLTGLSNRRHLHEHLTLALARADRHRTVVGLLALDLDGFKAVNDAHGHAVGDLLLCRVAARLRGAVRSTDLVARVGGDEFVILLADLPAHDASKAVVAVTEQVHAALAPPFELEHASATVTASTGAALYPGDATDPQRLLDLADAAMYRAKGRR